MIYRKAERNKLRKNYRCSTKHAALITAIKAKLKSRRYSNSVTDTDVIENAVNHYYEKLFKKPVENFKAN